MPESDSKPSSSTRLRALLGMALFLVVGALVVIGITLWVIGSPPRSQAVALLEGISAAEFAALPDDDAYPAAVALASDGTLYTGSYQTGALWTVDADGNVREISGARQLIGSVTGLDVGPDDTLYILDRISALEAKGAKVWRYTDGDLGLLFTLPDMPARGFLPDDIAVDGAGRIYISDRVGHLLAYDADGQSLAADDQPYWWQLPCATGCEATGLAYDEGRDAILVADAATDSMYRIKLADGAPGGSERIYTGVQAGGNGGQAGEYGIDGIDIAPSGDIYLALLAQNRVARLDGQQLTMLAKDFRGASDLVYDATRERLIVTNWNQFSLGFGTRPQLPFALDALELGGEQS